MPAFTVSKRGVSACYPPFIGPPLSPTLAARPPPSAHRAGGRCELAKAAAAGRERAGGTADGGAWTTGWQQGAVEKAV
jgi:hypothetical protein